ncbi:MAG TPA: hypothetical protein ENI23_01055 [bacterium]|nr:hypothetical protein [bacterium]
MIIFDRLRRNPELIRVTLLEKEKAIHAQTLTGRQRRIFISSLYQLSKNPEFSDRAQEILGPIEAIGVPQIITSVSDQDRRERGHEVVKSLVKLANDPTDREKSELARKRLDWIRKQAKESSIFSAASQELRDLRKR